MHLSIILPYYKKKFFIKETIESIAKQTFKDFELIIIYDQTDKKDLIYIKKIIPSKIKYKIIRNKRNLGVGKSRNIGLKNSSGKYVAFCDADDLWNFKKTEYQINFMKKNNILFSHTNYKIINKNNEQIGKMKIRKLLKHSDLIKSCDIALSSVIIKKSLLKKSIGFYSTKTKEDYALWLKLAKKTDIYGLKKYLVSWRKTDMSLSSNTFQKLKDAFKVYNIIENKSFLISIIYVVRLSIYYSIKKIKQKIIY
jgi:teichuronic acid biosynthesis glycosyltransferase TuaG|tara:strand:+ start:1567 stop:2325 length:759 start_codon:yes stop_codon:yes gene_type:complete